MRELLAVRSLMTIQFKSYLSYLKAISLRGSLLVVLAAARVNDFETGTHGI
jgi:hypothetical protein